MSDLQYPSMEGLCCPVPLSNQEQIVIGHGSGGVMTNDLIRRVFQNRLGNAELDRGNDSALIDQASGMPPGKRLVVSTDAHIVSPLFFPGGDIGRLAVCGTVNDVAMMGAQPRYLAATFILEEGFLISDLEIIVDSMAAACEEAGVEIITADTKVTERGKSDGLFISTTGLGWANADRLIAGDQAKPGDAVLISGALGNHGVAIAQARGNLGFQSNVHSDTAPLNGLVAELLDAVPEVHVLRDPTRGGLATTLVEIARQSNVTIQLHEEDLPIDRPVRMACELLGLDPLYMANEGKMIVFVPEKFKEHALEVLLAHPYGRQAALIGEVIDKPGAQVRLKTPYGTTRVLDMLAGEMLPRIC